MDLCKPLAGALCLLLVVSVAADDGPAADTPELKRLAAYAGQWEVTMTRQGEQAKTYRAQSKSEWILGGRFLRASYQGDELQGMLITTFDKRKNTYRRWQYDSGGDVTEYTGKWDDNAQMLRFEHVSEDKSIRIIVESKLDGDTENWSMIVKDRDGQELDEFKGVSHRK